MDTVISMLESAAAKFGGMPYLADGGEGGTPKSFRDAYEEARDAARYFLSLGLRRGTSFAIFAEGRSDWVTAEFGLLMAGLVSVPLSPKILPEEVLYRLEHSGAMGTVVSSGTAGVVHGVLPRLDIPGFLVVDLDGAGTCGTEAGNGERPAVAVQQVSFATVLEKGGADAFMNRKLDRSIAAIREDDVATICYTAGTSANPKGVMLTHKNYVANCRAAAEHLNVPTGLRTLLILPVDHSFAHTANIYTPLLLGGSVHFLDSSRGVAAALKSLPSKLREVKPQLILTVPALSGSFMRRIREEAVRKRPLVSLVFKAGLKCGAKYHGDGYLRPSLLVRLLCWAPYTLADLVVFRRVRSFFGGALAFCIGGGALLDRTQQSFFQALGVPLYQGYGLTEAGPVVSCNTPSRHKLGTSGTPLPSVECRIRLEDGAEAGTGVNGRILVRGPSVMKGYYKNPEATAEALRDGWLHTGDLGHFDEDGFLVVVGREKALLISEDGDKYSPEEIEEAIVNASGLASQVMLYNDHRKFTSALVTLDENGVSRLVARRRAPEPLTLLNEVASSLFSFEKMPQYRGRFPRKWLPSTFLILAEPFSEKNEMVNSAMKLVRHRIQETYRESLAYMYTNDGAHAHNRRNLDECAALLEKFRRR